MKELENQERGYLVPPFEIFKNKITLEEWAVWVVSLIKTGKLPLL